MPRNRELDPNRLNCYLCGEFDRLGPRCVHDIKYCGKCEAASNGPLCESLRERWEAKHPGPASTGTGARQLQSQAR